VTLSRLDLSNILVFVLVCARVARADETIVVHGDAPRGGLGDLLAPSEDARDRRHALGQAAFVTRIHVDEHAGEAATLTGVLGAAAGLHVQSLGGLGAFASVSVRGASSGQTTVLVDGVPLSRVASVTTDVGAYELGSFGEVDVYRGGVPAALGGAALGGALSLQTRVGRGASGEQLFVGAGVGSFGARSLRARWGVGDPVEGRAEVIEVGYAGARGDFVYYDDNGTNLTTRDDTWRTRGNDGYDHVDLVARAAAPTWSAGLRGLARRQGLPGSTSDPAMHARLDTASVTADGAWTHDGAIATRAQGWALVEDQGFHDPDGEIGLGADDRRYLTVSAGATGGGEWSRGRHDVSAAIDARGDYYRDDDVLTGSARVHGDRVGAGLAISDDVAFLGGRWDVEPAVRVDLLHSNPITDRYDPGMPEAARRTEWAPSPRVSTRALVTPDVAIKASAGYYYRAPTLSELYGDRGFLVGSPDLVSEHGPTADLGVVVAPASASGPIDRVLVEAAGFASWPRDTIALVTSGALVARALNVGDARIAGAEAAASARLARAVTFTLAYTFLDTAQSTDTPSYDGKPLPGRPRHELYARMDAARRVKGHLGVVWSELSWDAGNYLDQAALSRVPARTLVALGLKVEVGGGVTVGVDCRNLLDDRVENVALDPPPRPDLASVPRAVADVGGYPLPGRAFNLAVEWRR
jgi:vitamin B12 transporter